MAITVLVVAKETATREAMTKMLQASKYLVVPVSSAKAAYPCFSGIVFDAVVVEEAPDDPEIALVAFDAKAFQRAMKVVLICGTTPTGKRNPLIDYFIQKPYALDQIRRALDNLTGGADGRHGNILF